MGSLSCSITLQALNLSKAPLPPQFRAGEESLMNSVTILNASDDRIQTARQELQIEPTIELVELGKVSDTHGSPLPGKQDIGIGNMNF